MSWELVKIKKGLPCEEPFSEFLIYSVLSVCELDSLKAKDLSSELYDLPLGEWHPKRFQIPLLHCIEQQPRALHDLFSSDFKPVDGFSQDSCVGPGIVGKVQSQKLSDDLKTKRWFGVAKIFENRGDPLINVVCGSLFEKGIVQLLIPRRKFPQVL